MTFQPTRFSLPKAAALPVKDIQGFSYTARKRLISQGIVSALQLSEIASRDPSKLRQRTGLTATKANRILTETLGPLPDFNKVAVSARPLPPSGLPIGEMTPPIVKNSAAQAKWLDDRLANAPACPTAFSLRSRMPPVMDQGMHPYCVGSATCSVCGFNSGVPMSAKFAQQGSQSMHDYVGGGSFLYYSVQFQFNSGIVEEADYPYSPISDAAAFEALRPKALPFRSKGQSCLMLHGSDRRKMSDLLRHTVSGTLSPHLNPMPVLVSIVLYDSFVSTATSLDGLVPLPLPNEAHRGAHAMVVVGYVQKDDPSNPFGLDYFEVRNSWGDWAHDNPFDAVGHAMIPASYFNTQNLLEAYVIIQNNCWRNSLEN